MSEPVSALPPSRSSAYGGRGYATFGDILRALTPRGFVTEGLVAINVLVYVAMCARGVSPSSPTTGDLRAWGADFGPLTAGGEWWRLFTATFVHVGILHLAMNMYVLWSSGRLVERILGNAGFLVAYVASGLAGSVASIVWSPLVTSAGASGAIFGVYGAMLGFVLRERTSIPREAVQSLLKMGVFFVGINVMIGLRVPGIDMAAHLGGLAGGFVAGLALAHPLTPDGAAGRVKRAVILAVGTLFAVAASTRLMTRSVAGAPLLSSVSSGSRAAV